MQRHLLEHTPQGRFVLALAEHYRDTMRSILIEADEAFRRWPEIRCVEVVGGEFDGFHIPRSLWTGPRIKPGMKR